MNPVLAELHQAHVQRRMRMSAAPKRLKAKNWAPVLCSESTVVVARPSQIWRPRNGPQANAHVQAYHGFRARDANDHVRTYLIYKLETLGISTDRRVEPSIQRVIAATSRITGIAEVDIRSAQRAAPMVRARQIAMYLAKTMTSKSLPDIGQRMGGRDHTTVLHGYRKMLDLKDDPAVGPIISAVRAEIEASLPVQAQAGER